MPSSRVSATLVAVLVISIFGASQCQEDGWKQCTGTFCEKWMCEQNNNRKCNIAKLIDSTLTDETCAQAKGTSAMSAALGACNDFQTDPTSPICTFTDAAGVVKTGDVGIKYNSDSCIPPPGAPDNYVPDQLKTVGAQQVYVETTALIEIGIKKTADAVALVTSDDAGKCTEFKPNDPTLPDCVCTAQSADQITACANTVKEEVFNKQESYVNQYAQEFVAAAAPLYLTYEVPGIETAEQAQQAASSAPSLAVQEQFEGNDVYVPPSPEPKPSPGDSSKRRRLRERRVVDRAMLREFQPNLAA